MTTDVFPLLIAQSDPPEPNTPLTLGLDFIFGAVPVAAVVLIALRRPVGIYRRYYRYVAILLLLLGFYVVPALLVQVASAAGGGPKAIALGLGVSTALIVAARRAHRDRRALRPAPVMRPWYRGVDYAFGVVSYSVLRLGSGTPALRCEARPWSIG